MAAVWRLAKSLETLRSQVNAAYPNRTKVSDGTIGDAAHAATASDHNPNAYGVVCALDLTHDPKNGFDAHALADHIAENPPRELKYIISDSRIAGDFTDWNWGWYEGINPHSSHVHFSVGDGVDGSSRPPYDSTKPWNINTKEVEVIGNKNHVKVLFKQFVNREPTATEIKDYSGKTLEYALNKLHPARKDLGKILKQLSSTEATLKQTAAALDAARKAGAMSEELKRQLKTTQSESEKRLKEIERLKQERASDEATGNAFIRWLGSLFNKGE